jgi:hypothetical protein
MNWRIKAQFAERIRMIAAGIIAKHPEDDRSSPIDGSNDQPSCKDVFVDSDERSELVPTIMYFQGRALRSASF